MDPISKLEWTCQSRQIRQLCLCVSTSGRDRFHPLPPPTPPPPPCHRSGLKGVVELQDVGAMQKPDRHDIPRGQPDGQDKSHERHAVPELEELEDHIHQASDQEVRSDCNPPMLMRARPCGGRSPFPPRK